jgi:tripartite-type tricarboxylate transporter receptor subunit TctC
MSGRLLRAALAAVTTTMLAVPAFGQVQPLRIVFGFGAGGAGDISARTIADHMRTTLGRPVIVENRPGAGGRIAIDVVKSAAADGSTLLYTPMGPMALAPHVYDRLRYDPVKDFEPVAHVQESQLVLAVAATVPATSLAEYAAILKKDPKMGFFGVAPLGGLPHFLGLNFAAANGVQLTAVAYKSGAEMTQALLSGEMPATFFTPDQLIALHQSGKVRILAVSGSRRHAALPEVPTLREAGYDLEAKTWFGLFAPAGTPTAAVEQVAAAVGAAVRDPAVAKRLAELGFEPTGRGPADLARALEVDHSRWGPVIKASGFRMND